MIDPRTHRTLRTIGWSLVAGLAAAYLFYFSAAWFAGGRFDTFDHIGSAAPQDKHCRCDRLTASEQTRTHNPSAKPKGLI